MNNERIEELKDELRSLNIAKLEIDKLIEEKSNEIRLLVLKNKEELKNE